MSEFIRALRSQIWNDLRKGYNRNHMFVRLTDRVEKLERLDTEASTHVESVIAMRTGFTGEPPYVGWRGLGLALNEALDERDALRAENARLREALDPKRLHNTLGWADVERADNMKYPPSDSLYIALCSYFEGHVYRPKDDPCDETGWGQWVIQKTEEALDLVAASIIRSTTAKAKGADR